jgi:leader peptidase (prepilin peptidase)/N-methyltransferase
MTMAVESPKVSRKVDLYVLIGLTPLLLGALVVLTTLPDKSAENMVTQLYVFCFLVLAAFDLWTWRVPNLLIYPFILFALLATAVFDLSLVDNALLGGLACLAIMFVLAVIGRGSMGMGDVKAGCFIGCCLGPVPGFAALVIGFAAGAIIAVPILLLRLRSRKDSIPLTPFLAAGAIAMIVMIGPVVAQPR